MVRFGLQAPDQASSEGSTARAAASEQPSSSQPQHAQHAVSREEEEERRGLVCMVCKEGYGSRPTELLGAYCYCMKLHAGEGFGADPEVWNGPSPARADTLQVMHTATSHKGPMVFFLGRRSGIGLEADVFQYCNHG